jgi:DNA-binding transcriptional MerR regulator
MDSVAFHIGEAARQLGVTPKHLRLLEREGRVPPACRDFNGRIYTEFDLALLRSMGIGQRPRKLKRVDEVLGGAR